MAFEGKQLDEILHENRMLFLFGPITEELSLRIIPMLLVMDGVSQDPIKLHINSAGGEVSAGLAIYDTMQFVSAPVHTVCIGRAVSMGAWLLAAGAKGHRVAAENSRVMIHRGRTNIGGSFTYADLKIEVDEFSRTEERMIRLLAMHCGKPEAEVRKAIERDRWMTPEEALEFGLIDRIARPDQKA